MKCLYEKCGQEIVRDPGDPITGPFCSNEHRWFAAQPKEKQPLVDYAAWKPKRPLAPVDLDAH
jgi:hypothetical protein